jgi:hypothetical protein
MRTYSPKVEAEITFLLLQLEALLRQRKAEAR